MVFVGDLSTLGHFVDTYDANFGVQPEGHTDSVETGTQVGGTTRNANDRHDLLPLVSR
jgi:hypothetical protein